MKIAYEKENITMAYSNGNGLVDGWWVLVVYVILRVLYCVISTEMAIVVS